MAIRQTRRSVSLSRQAYERAHAAAEMAKMPLSAYTEAALDAAIRSGQHAIAVKAERPPPVPKVKALPPEALAVPMALLLKERPAELDDLMLDEASGPRIEYDDEEGA